MAPDSAIINDLLDKLDEEDYKIAISFLQYLSDMRKKKRIAESTETLAHIQEMFKEDKGWDSKDLTLYKVLPSAVMIHIFCHDNLQRNSNQIKG